MFDEVSPTTNLQFVGILVALLVDVEGFVHKYQRYECVRKSPVQVEFSAWNFKYSTPSIVSLAGVEFITRGSVRVVPCTGGLITAFEDAVNIVVSPPGLVPFISEIK